MIILDVALELMGKILALPDSLYKSVMPDTAILYNLWQPTLDIKTPVRISRPNKLEVTPNVSQAFLYLFACDYNGVIIPNGFFLYFNGVT